MRIAPMSVGAWMLAIAAVAMPAVTVGDAAPTFSLPGSDGRVYRLTDYKGKQAVVVAWFAKAFTGG